jgi:hypothetical protein
MSDTTSYEPISESNPMPRTPPPNVLAILLPSEPKPSVLTRLKELFIPRR